MDISNCHIDYEYKYSIKYHKKRRSWRLSIQTHLLIDLLALTDHENHIKGDKVSFRHDNISFSE